MATGMMDAVLAQAGKAVTAKKMTQEKSNPSPFKKVSTKAKKAKKSKKSNKKKPPFGKSAKGSSALY